jgi:VanZ family protein
MLKLLNKFSRRFYRIVFWIWFAFLTIASVWPFNPNTNIIIRGFKIRMDYLEHLIIYAILGFLFVISSKVRIRRIVVFLASIVGFAYGFLMEYIQTFLPGRAYNVYDMMFNLIGLAAGLSMAYFYYDKKMFYRFDNE